MNQKFKRFIALVLAFVITMPNVVFATEKKYVYIPEIQVEDDVKMGNLYWLASPEIKMSESGDNHYLVKVARGGDISTESSIVVKFSDVTAKYGKDYKAYLYNGGIFNEADKDKDALSVIEKIDGQDYSSFEIGDSEQLVRDMEDNAVSGGAIGVEIAKGINEAVASNKEEKGENGEEYRNAADDVDILQFEDETIQQIEAELVIAEESTEATTAEESAEATTDEGTELDISTLAGARQAFTGIESDRVKPKASMDIVDTFTQLQAYQDLADTISDSMVTARLEIAFDADESEKYIEIVPIDNKESDSTRVFNITIGDPTGDFTVSAYSTAVATIEDDEEPVNAVVSMGALTLTPDLGSDHVSITVLREGGINDVVSVMLKSRSKTAMSGRDFSPVNAEVVFPFGVKERTIDVSINTEYIKEESEFELYIDTPVACEIENDTTRVVIQPYKADEDVKLNSVQDNSEDGEVALFMGDTHRNNNARIYFPEIVTNNGSMRWIEKSGGFKDNCQPEGNDGWYIRPTDDRKWARAEFFIGDGNTRYDVNGMTFSYRGKYAARPYDGTAKAGFRIEHYNNNAIWYSNDWQFTGGSSGWTERTIYTGYGNVRGVQVYAEDGKGIGRDIQAHFTDIYPIKRQFKITLAPADKMYLRTVTGNKVELKEVQPKASVSNKMSKSLGIDAADTDTLAYRTSGELLSVTSNNNEYFRLVGLYAVNSQNPNELIKIADANGSNTVSFTLDNNLLRKLIRRNKNDNWDFVTLSDRNGGGKYGNITLKPVFEYIDKKVYVERNTAFENNISIDMYNQLGTVSVNGSEYILDDNTFQMEIKPNDRLGNVFHYGDEFIVNTNAKYSDFARAAGVGYRVGVNINTMDKNRHDIRNADGSYNFTRSNSKSVLKNNAIAFYPVLTEKENGLTVLVRKSDIDNGVLDVGHGILANMKDKQVVVENKNGTEYYRFLATKDVKMGTYYQYAARAKDGYAVKWYDDVKKVTYSGNEMLYRPESMSDTDNVLLISAENNDVVYARFKGNLNYNVYDISIGTDSAFTMPASDAGITIGGTGTVTDKNGYFETTEVGAYINGTKVIRRVSCNNKYSYKEYDINISNKKLAVPKTETYNKYLVENVTKHESYVTYEPYDELVCVLWFGKVTFGDENAEYDEVTKGFFGKKESRYKKVEKEVVKFKAYDVTESVSEQVTNTVYTFNMGNIGVELPYTGTNIVDVNVYMDSNTLPEPGVIDINDSVYTFRADVVENDNEHIKELKFIICEPVTKKIKYEIPAQFESSSGQWVAFEKMDIAMSGTYAKGDTLYAKISTDKNNSGVSGSLTEYYPVYTGYDFIQADSQYDTYEPQNFNIPTNASFISLPMLDKLATGFDFPYVSIALEQQPTGEYRVKLGANISDIVSKAAGTNLSAASDDAQMGYTDGIDWKHPFKQIGARAEFAKDSIFKKKLSETPLLNGATSRLGPTQFTVSIIVGGYIDFGKRAVEYNGNKIEKFVVTGGGGYLGVTLSFKKNFYFIIAGMVPAYIGGSASGTLIGNLGATQKSNAIVSLDDMKRNQLDIDDALAFNGNLNASMAVALYAGVGLCDVLGIRLEGDVDLALIWEPLAKKIYAMNGEDDADYTNSKIHEVGFTVQFSLGGKVDLLLFTIPLMYKFEPIHSGFNKDIQNAHVRKVPQTTVNPDGTSTTVDNRGTVADGWYYIRNVSNNNYIEVKDGKTSLISKTSSENPNMRFYVSTKNLQTTLQPYEKFADGSSSYLMFKKEKDKNILVASDALNSSAITTYQKFAVSEVNLGDFNVKSQAEGVDYFLNVDSDNSLIFTDTEQSNKVLWRFEAVDTPLENGMYTFKCDGKYLSDVNGKAALASSISNSSKWTIESADNDYVMLKNVSTNKYLYVDSDSSANGVTVSVKNNDNTNAVKFKTKKLTDGSYHIVTAYSLGRKYLTAYVNSNEIVSNDLNDTYNNKWTIEQTAIDTPTQTKTKQTRTAKSGNDSNIDLLEYSDDYVFNDMSEETNIISDDSVYLRTRTTGDSVWRGSDGDISLFSGFTLSSEKTLVENSYERPDSQVVDLGNGDYMLFFIDNDSSKGELERTTLKFATYKNGSWSQPKVVQEDGTADFQPSVMSAGDKVAVAWISSDPGAEKTGDATQYLTTMEVYTTLIDKKSETVGEITRLTNDVYYDYDPTVIYDSTTGDIIVYYLMSTDMGESFLEAANSFTNNCIIAYMLYDNSKGKWLKDYYYPEEISNPDVAQELIDNWGGQRFLAAPIPDLGMNDPLITDFTAIGYNGLAVYGFTVDKDNDSSTNEDRDLFIKVYDFTTHKNHPVIRITDDEEGVADTMPQFVRAGGENGNTYLYWFRGDNKLSYIDVSDLAHNGLNADGTISDDYELSYADVYVNLPPSMKKGSNEAYATMSYYKVCVDSKDNIYVIWVDADRETNKQEVFATAVITDDETGETSYADAYQLTHSNKHNDEPTFLVDDTGNMIVISTRYDSERTDNATDPLIIKNTELVASVFTPIGELYAENIELGNVNPKVGDTVNVDAKLYNRGLTVANGYTVKLYEMRGEETLREIETITGTDVVKAGDYCQFTYQWTAPSDMDGVSLGIEVTEGGMPNSNIAVSEPLEVSPNITVDGVGIKQENDSFMLHTVLTNNGNVATTDTDNLNLVYYPEKAKAEMLGISEESFVKYSIPEIAPGESKEYNIEVDNLEGEYFGAYGYIPVLAAVTNANDEVISNDVIDYIIMNNPVDITVNDTEQIVINANEGLDLSASWTPYDRFSDGNAVFSVEDTSVATVVDNQLVGVSKGTTTLKVTVEPYGISKEVEIVVLGSQAPDDNPDKPNNDTASYGGGGRSSKKAAETTTEATTADKTTENKVETPIFSDILNHWAENVINNVASLGVIKGYTDSTFKPDNSITRAEFLAILYNSNLADTENTNVELEFKDISGNEWYSKYVAWGAANNIVVGYDDGTFRGNSYISREEMAVMISKFIAVAKINIEAHKPVVFADDADIAPWAKEYVDDISSRSVVRGDNNNLYAPKKALTRAETAVIINQLLN